MVIVDTHCHVSQGWYEPLEGLLYQMDHNNVEHALLVQIGGQTDNRYQAECVRRYPDRLTSIVLVDPNSPTVLQDLEQLAEEGATGARLHAGDRSPGDDPLAIWRKSQALQLQISCRGGLNDFAADDFEQLVRALPNLNIIIEHLGGVKEANSPEPPYSLAEKVFGLSRYKNTYMKIHGLGEFCSRAMPVSQPFPFKQPIPPFLDMVYNTFGPERIMWGSDFPPVSGREGYKNALELTKAQLSDKSDKDLAQIFGGTALKLFRFS